MLKWSICNIYRIAKDIKSKLSRDIAKYIEQNQYVLYACRLSKGHMNNIWKTAESNNLNVWGVLQLLLMQLVLLLLWLFQTVTAFNCLNLWLLATANTCECDWLRLRPQLIVTTIASAYDFDCINYFAIANNKTIPQNWSNAKKTGIDWLVGFRA